MRLVDGRTHVPASAAVHGMRNVWSQWPGALLAQGYGVVAAPTNGSSGKADVVLDRNGTIFMSEGHLAGSSGKKTQQTYRTAIPTRRNEVIFSGAGCAALATSYGSDCVINATRTFIADYDVDAVSVFPNAGLATVAGQFLEHYMYQTGSVMGPSVVVEGAPPLFSIVKVPLHSNSTYVVKLLNVDQECTFSYSLTTYTPDSPGGEQVALRRWSKTYTTRMLVVHRKGHSCGCCMCIL